MVDPVFLEYRIQEMQTIAICEMKEEDTQAQIMFWEMMNSVMLDNGHPPADFRGFMADEAGANWRANTFSTVVLTR